MAKKNKKGKGIDLEEINVILRIPKGAAAVTVGAVLINADGKTQKVEKRLDTQDIFKARQDFLDNVEGGDEYDAKFVITDKGREWLDELRRNEGISTPQEDF